MNIVKNIKNGSWHVELVEVEYENGKPGQIDWLYNKCKIINIDSFISTQRQMNIHYSNVLQYFLHIKKKKIYKFYTHNIFNFT